MPGAALTSELAAVRGAIRRAQSEAEEELDRGEEDEDEADCLFTDSEEEGEAGPDAAQLAAEAAAQLAAELAQTDCHLCRGPLGAAPVRLASALCRHGLCAGCAASTIRYFSECPICSAPVMRGSGLEPGSITVQLDAVEPFSPPPRPTVLLEFGNAAERYAGFLGVVPMVWAVVGGGG